ncbi:7836_t:CDS:2, partial [Funneliformis mosseae]
MSELNKSLNNEYSSNFIGDKVRIFIRSPTTPLPDGYFILTNPNSSVLSLKQIIFKTHPAKPAIRDQKLIYRGRVLGDNDLIENVLKDGLETDQTFHLVVKPSFQAIAETTGIPISPPNSHPTSQNHTSTSTHFSQITNSVQQQSIPNTIQNPGYIYMPQNHAQYNHSVTPLDPSQNQSLQPSQQPFSIPMGYYYVMINGLPYLVPIQYSLPYTYSYQIIQTQPIVQPQPNVAPVAEHHHDNAARNQRRANTLLLVVKLGFLVYIFSQNASAERMILLYISALVYFLYQTGRLRIVRRRRRVLVPVPNEFFVQQLPQVAAAAFRNQAGIQPRPD